MNADKKIFALLLICVAVILGAGIFLAMPRIKDHYQLTGQEALTAEMAGKIDLYLDRMSSDLRTIASLPTFQNWDVSRPPDLSFLRKNNWQYFDEFFLFNSSGEMIKSTDTTYQSFKLSINDSTGRKWGEFSLTMISDTGGENTPALFSPLINSKGQQTGWLAGTVNPQMLDAGSGPVAGETVMLYLSDSQGSISGIIPSKAAPDITGPAKLLKASSGRSSSKRLITRNMSLVSAEISYPGWSAITLRNRYPAHKSFNGEYLNISLAMVAISLVLLLLAGYYIKIVLRPLSRFIDRINTNFTDQETGNLDSLSARLEVLLGNINVLDSVPIGVMVVDRNGLIRFFNREAGEITSQDPALVTGKSMKNYFPNNYFNYTMESINSRREYMGLRNIIMVGDFFKELLLNICPLYHEDTVSGAVATFQDVTPQRKMIEVEAAYTLSRDLASQRDLNSTVQIIAKAAAEMVDIEYSAIFLADIDGNLLIRSFHGIPSGMVEKYNDKPYHVDGPEIKDLYRNKSPLIHGDVRNKNNLKPLIIIPDVFSLYSFPVFYENRLIGLINLYSSDKNKLSKDKIYLIQSLSGQVNTAITNFYEFQKIKAMASTDGLTGLFNKKYFLENINMEVNSASASASTLSLAMIDIDNFKVINDTFGHQAGDAVLKEVAGIVTQSLRDSDCICRYGGEEFAVIMPETSKEKALEVMERVRSRVEMASVPRNETDHLNITISVGVASYPQDCDSSETLISHSDTALYAAKRSGKNKVFGYKERGHTSPA
ncbi:MAG: hypothetical protein VR68_00060 [Peptococcaceae bacterium BRH_c4a]|nr:MAG: hypothetical protein VR68_00060 [Peptococcaceae bacterium BRH_c4a]